MKRRLLRVLGVALVVASLLGTGVAWVAWQGWHARTHLLAAADLARQLQRQLETGQVDAARETLMALQGQTRAARDRTTDPGWRVGRRTPGVGDDLAAVAAVAEAMDDLAYEGMPSLVEVAADLDPSRLVPHDGRVPLAPLQRAVPAITAADVAVRRARDRVAAVPTEGLMPAVRTAVTALRADLDQAARTTATAVRAATLLPPMLGANAPRTYLVLFQNNAEVRATGGMPGAFAVIEARDGAVRVIDQGKASAELGVFEEPVLPLDPNLRALYTDRPGIYPANVNLTPHFPTAAQLAREMYRRRTGELVDGVLATDPIALSYLLRATGPVEVPGGAPLTSANAVRVLLSDVYSQAEERNEYFAAAALATFKAVMESGVDPAVATAQLARAAGERRILVWSADPAEQRLIAGTVLGGELPTDDGPRPTVGVFLNDGSGAKLGYHLTQAAELRAGECRPDGRRELRLRVTLGSTAPAEGLPDYVLGMGLAGDPYTVRTNVSLFSPAQGALVEVRLDGRRVPVGAGTERERAVGILTVDLAPGQRRTIEATFLTAELPTTGPVAADLWLTPMVTSWAETLESPMVCPSYS